MNFNLARAMREATELTRARKLAEATRVIQDALAGRRPDGSVLPEGATSDGSQRTEEVRQVEHAAQVERAPQGGVRAESADSDQPHLSGRLGQRLKRSLGEVVTTLRQAKLRG